MYWGRIRTDRLLIRDQVRLAVTSEHIALLALTLTKPTWSRVKVLRLFISTASPITRLRSVRWLPSRRAKAQAISISLTA